MDAAEMVVNAAGDEDRNFAEIHIVQQVVKDMEEMVEVVEIVVLAVVIVVAALEVVTAVAAVVVVGPVAEAVVPYCRQSANFVREEGHHLSEILDSQ